MEPSDARVEHLTTQMKWRVEEGGGEAVYRLGVKDSGEILGLEPQALEKSLQTMTRMADKLVVWVCLSTFFSLSLCVCVVQDWCQCESGEKVQV